MKTKTISLYIGWPVLRRPQLAGFQAPRDTRPQAGELVLP